MIEGGVRGGRGLQIGPDTRLADDGKRLGLSESALDVSFNCRRQQYFNHSRDIIYILY